MMAYHRQTRLKIDGKSFVVPSDKEVKRRRIKHLQKYEKQIKSAELNNLPQIVNNLYSYLIKKNILEDQEFIKNELLIQISILIDAYKYSYSPSECQEIRSQLLYGMISHQRKFCQEKKSETETALIKKIAGWHPFKSFFAVRKVFSQYKNENLYKKLENRFSAILKE